MSKYIVDIFGEIEGDYEIIKKYEEPILDKIKTEIAELQLIGYAIIDGKIEIATRAVMQIIDKYKGSER